MEPQQNGRKLDALTPREREVLSLVARNLTNGEIASVLGVSFSTVKTHVSEILGRLGVQSREEAAAIWRQEGKRRLPRPSRLSRPSWLVGPFLPAVVGGAVTGVIATVAIVAIVVGVLATAPQNRAERQPLFVDINSLSRDVPMTVGVYGHDHLGRDMQVWALRTGDETAIAMLGRDPHSGCTVLRWDFLDTTEPPGNFPRVGVFNALCSGWAFANAGEVTFGAASRSLDRFVSTVSGTTVEIDLAQVVLGECRELQGLTTIRECSPPGSPRVVSELPAPVIPDWGAEE